MDLSSAARRVADSCSARASAFACDSALASPLASPRMADAGSVTNLSSACIRAVPACDSLASPSNLCCVVCAARRDEAAAR
eukprot:6960094-Pyramimonas_sp.AAC.1